MATEQNKEKCHGAQLPADVEYVVTEQGAVNLRGISTKQQDEALIGIALPNFRDDLTAAACKVTLVSGVENDIHSNSTYTRKGF